MEGDFMSKKSVIGALAGGAIIGATAGVLLAPKSGKETRKDIVKAAAKISKKVKNMSAADVKKYVTKKVSNIEKALKDLEKEKVVKDAKKKIKSIQKDVANLYEDIKDNTEEQVKEIVDTLRDKVEEVNEKIMSK